MKVAVIGATGLVGTQILRVLEERRFPLDVMIPAASEKSAGKTLRSGGKDIPVVTLEQALEAGPDIAIFSAGGAVSLEWAPRFTDSGCRVVDNSSAWRMDERVKLVVPEINGSSIQSSDMIIANPNCSTIQMTLALAPLHKRFRIRRIIVSTYQSVTGSGMKAVRQLEHERAGIVPAPAYPHPIDMNCLPHCDVFLENDYTREEMKLVNETRKIFGDDGIAVTATAVRVPVMGGHSESVYVEFERDFTMEEIRDLLSRGEGIEVYDDPGKNRYPMPVMAAGSDQVFVGRIRKDLFHPKGLNLWIVADNLRKGAATNAVQIAEIIRKKMMP
ncbi:MAG: aspartate-semialdehyde dehydrogenase [Bacteroidales bacterium]|nr:aspartate-semialdehyde dehydrogenase [Bacteroidales bacterium]